MFPGSYLLREGGTERGLGTRLSHRTNQKFEEVGNKRGGGGWVGWWRKPKKEKKKIIT